MTVSPGNEPSEGAGTTVPQPVKNDAKVSAKRIKDTVKRSLSSLVME
jgi:hypothetical protein